MRPSLTTLTLIPLGLVVGCTETPTAAPDAVRRVPSHQAVLAALSTLHTDTTDTWFSADLAFSPSMSVGLPEPGYNPATGSIGLSAESPTATIQLHVEGGYLATGETLLHVQILNDGVSDPVPTDPVAFRFVNDVPTLFDRTGAVLAMNADDYAAAQDIIDDIGSFRDLVFDVTGGAGDSSGTGGTFFARDKSDSVDVESTETRGTDRHLKAIRHVVSRRRGPSRISTGFEVTLRNVRSHTNSARDAARRERRAAEDARRVTGTRDRKSVV